MIVADDLEKIQPPLHPWPLGSEIADAAIKYNVRLAPQKFSVQFGGKWLAKLPQGTSHRAYAHIADSGVYSVIDILCGTPYKNIHLGGKMPWVSQALISALVFWFSFICSLIQAVDMAAGCSLRVRLPFIGFCDRLPLSTSTGCLFQYFYDNGFSKDELHMLGISRLTMTLTRDQIRYFNSISNGKFIAYVNKLSVTRSVNHIAAKPFLGSRSIVLPFTKLQFLRFGATEVVPSGSVSAPTIQALGGVRQVVTSLINGRLASENGVSWDWSLWPTDMLRLRPTWTLTNNNYDIVSQRTSEYIRHFPEDTERTHLPQRFTESLKSVFAFRATEAAPLANTIRPAQYSRSFEPSRMARVFRTRYMSLAPILEGKADAEVFKNAQQVLSQHRLFGTNGKRMFPDWDAQEMTRNQDIFQLSSRVQTREYRELAFRLWSKYLLAVQAESMMRTLQGGALAVIDTTAGIAITHMNAHYIPPNPNANPPVLAATNPELPFWDPAAQLALERGFKQFFDASGMSREQIAALLGCVAPTTLDRTPRLRFTQANGTHTTYWFGNGKFLFPNQVDEIFLHYGMGNIPSAVDQQWILDHTHDMPSSALLASVIRIVAGKLDIADDLATGLDLAMHQGVIYRNRDILNRYANAPNRDGQMFSSGDDSLFMPRNISIDGYFSPFFEAGLLPTKQTQLLAPNRYDEVIHAQALISHARAVSLNWASKAVTLLGQHWTAATPGAAVANVNQWLRNRIDAWIRDYYDSYANPWSLMHINACATQFGFSISNRAALHESGMVQPQWASWQAPYLVNHYLELWMMKIIPSFQVLPYYDNQAKTSKLIMDTDYGTAVPSLPTLNENRELKISREIATIPGRNYFGDGGVEYNGQFIVAQGGGAVNAGEWRYEDPLNDFRVMDPSWSEAPYTYQLGQNWNRIHTVHMANPGSAFADFAVPGTLRTFQEIGNKVLSWGFRQSLDPLQLMSGEQVSRLHKLGCGMPHQSLMVNYINPYAVRSQVDQIGDYSIVILSAGNRFAGMTLQPSEPVLVAADDRLNRFRGEQQSFNLPAPPAGQGQDLAPVRIASSIRRDNAKQHQGTIKFMSKYPVFTDDLPRIPEIQVEYDDTSIRALQPQDATPAQLDDADTETDSSSIVDIPSTNEQGHVVTPYMSDREIQSLLRKADMLGAVDTKALDFYRTQALEEYEAKVDAEFQDLLAEMNARAAAKRIQHTTRPSLRNRIAHVAKHDTLPPFSGYTARPQRARKSAFTRPSESSVSNVQPTKKTVTFTANAKGSLPTEPVEFNDSAASQMQTRAEQQADAISKHNFPNVRVKLPNSPTLQQIKDNAKTNFGFSVSPATPTQQFMRSEIPVGYPEHSSDTEAAEAAPFEFSETFKLGVGNELSKSEVSDPKN